MGRASSASNPRRDLQEGEVSLEQACPLPQGEGELVPALVAEPAMGLCNWLCKRLKAGWQKVLSLGERISVRAGVNQNGMELAINHESQKGERDDAMVPLAHLPGSGDDAAPIDDGAQAKTTAVLLNQILAGEFHPAIERTRGVHGAGLADAARGNRRARNLVPREARGLFAPRMLLQDGWRIDGTFLGLYFP